MFGMIFDIFTVSLRRKFDAALNVEDPFSSFSTLLITLSSSIFDLAFVPLNQAGIAETASCSVMDDPDLGFDLRFVLLPDMMVNFRVLQ